jgi:hypothetical protein
MSMDLTPFCLPALGNHGEVAVASTLAGNRRGPGLGVTRGGAADRAQTARDLEELGPFFHPPAADCLHYVRSHFVDIPTVLQ